MNCGKIKDLLSPYIDNQLTARQRAQVEQHLTTCVECAHELAVLREALQVVAELPQQELPAGFREGLHTRLVQAHAEAGAQSTADSTVRTRPTRSRVSEGWFARMRQQTRRPVWRGALATAATVALLFAVVNQALPGWDGNLWSLNRYGTRLAGQAPPTDAASQAPGGRAPEPAPSPPALGSLDEQSRAPDKGVISTDTGSWTLSSDGSMIIRNASLTVQVEDFITAERKVGPAVDVAGGYIEGSSIMLDGKVRSGWWRVRVPQGKFTETLIKFEELGKLTHKEMGSEDVSGAIIDLEARLINLRRQELRLGELLSEAKTLDEILRVENELNRVRYQIEAAEGQVKWYRERVSMATIYLHLTEPAATSLPPVPGADLWGRLYQAFLATWRGIFRFLEGFVVFIASVTPVVALLGAAWWGFGRYRKSRPGR